LLAFTRAGADSQLLPHIFQLFVSIIKYGRLITGGAYDDTKQPSLILTLNKKTRVIEKGCIVAKKGTICPIFEGETPLLKKDPKRWPFIDGHSIKAVNTRLLLVLGKTSLASV
jgi:hypothetical protein